MSSYWLQFGLVTNVLLSCYCYHQSSYCRSYVWFRCTLSVVRWLWCYYSTGI